MHQDVRKELPKTIDITRLAVGVTIILVCSNEYNGTTTFTLRVAYPREKVVEVEDNFTFQPYWAYIDSGEIMEDHSVALKHQKGTKMTGDVIMARVVGEGWEYEVWNKEIK